MLYIVPCVVLGALVGTAVVVLGAIFAKDTLAEW